MRKNKNGKLTQLRHTCEKGKKVYRAMMPRLVRKGLRGKYIAIEPDTGKIYMGENRLQALREALKDNPSKTFYTAKIGYKASAALRRNI